MTPHPEPRPTLHPTGFPQGDGAHRCSACAWAARDGSVRRCVAASRHGEPGPVLPDDAPACAYFEPPVRCEPCGACCREAFDSVPVGPEDEHTARARPDLIRTDGSWRDLRRVPTERGTRCVALRGDGREAPFRCAIYADRPSACADLEAGSWNCWFARRRVGLWPPDASRAP